MDGMGRMVIFVVMEIEIIEGVVEIKEWVLRVWGIIIEGGNGRISRGYVIGVRIGFE